jgi:hypothetical protein
MKHRKAIITMPSGFLLVDYYVAKLALKTITAGTRQYMRALHHTCWEKRWNDEKAGASTHNYSEGVGSKSHMPIPLVPIRLLTAFLLPVGRCSFQLT